MKTDPQSSLRRRQRAARRYKPDEVKLLLVAESPPRGKPGESERYFYFENVAKHDSLFLSIAKELLKTDPQRSAKRQLLRELQKRGVFLVDLKPDPTDPRPLPTHVPQLIRTCKRLQPQKIILIKVDVYDAAYADLAQAGLPVVNERIPFPGSGRQTEFRNQFGRALRRRPTAANVSSA